MHDASRLPAVQRAFVAAIRSDDQQVLDMLEGDADVNRERLAIYRGNTVGNATKALQLVYPVIGQIVGKDFFEGLGRAFWTTYPSHSGDLNEYGEHFAEFLAGFPHAAGMPYLPDTARIEWQVSRAAIAADHHPVDLSALGSFAPEIVGAVRFELQPGLCFLQSAWPVGDIWLQHQPGYDSVNIDLHVAQTVAVHRRGMRVDVALMGKAEFALWQGALAGEPLVQMLDRAFAVDESFDVQSALHGGFAREFVCGCTLDESCAPL